MKKIFIGLVALACVATSSAATKADTIAVNSAKIERVIVHNTTNTKGAKVVKYYMLYGGELVSTSKNVVEKYNLCKQYHARIALAMVKRGSNKRIILN